MAKSDDFFVRFGSNAAQFGKQLETDLGPARRAVGTFAKQLVDLETLAADRRAATTVHLGAMSKEAAAVQARLDKLAEAQTSAGIDPAEVNVKQIANDALQDIGRVAAELDNVIDKLAQFAKIVDKTNPELRRARQKQNRSEGQSEAALVRERDPIRKTFVTAGTPGSERLIDRLPPISLSALSARLTPPVEGPLRGGGGPVQLANIPKATIDEASFTRVVSAVEKNVKATRDVEKAIKRLDGRLNRGESKGADSTAADAQAETAKKEARKEKKARDEASTEEREPKPSRRQRQLEESTNKLAAESRALHAEIEKLSLEMQETGQQSDVVVRKLNQVAEIDKRLASQREAIAKNETRAAQQERQRRKAAQEARREAEIRISPEQREFRQTERARLELAANPDLESLVGRGKGQLGKGDLVGIAESLNRQGYETNLGPTRDGIPRATIKKLVEIIAASGRAYVASNRATADDLTLRRTERPDGVVGPDVQKLLDGGRLADALEGYTRVSGRLGLSPERALQLLGQNRASGGRDPDRYSKGRLEVGARIGDELRDEVREAPDVLSQYARQIRIAAREDVVKQLRGNDQFNPYEIDFRAQTQGRGPAASTARRSVSAMLAATQDIDRFALNLAKLDQKLVKAQRAQEAIMRSLDKYERLERKPTTQEAEQYTANLAALEPASARVAEARARLEQEKQFFYDPTGGTADFLLNPSFQEGARRRTESREKYEAEAEAASEKARERFLSEQALRDATQQFFGGSRIFATKEGNTRDYFARNLPGVKNVGSGANRRLGLEDELMGSAQNRQNLERMNRGLRSYNNQLLKLIKQTSDSDVSEETLNSTRGKVVAALNKLLGSYQRIFPSSQPPDITSFLPPTLFQGNVLQGIAADETRAQDRVVDIDTLQDGGQAARRRQRTSQNAQVIAEMDAAIKAARQDPERAEKLQAQIVKSLKKRVTSLKAEIKELSTLAKQGDDDAKASLGLRRTELDRVQKAKRVVTGNYLATEVEDFATNKVGNATGRVQATERSLAQATERLAKLRAEQAKRLATIREVLPESSQKAFDQAVARRDKLRERVAEVRTSEDARADVNLGAENVKRREAAATKLAGLEQKLGAAGAEITQFIEYAARLSDDREGPNPLDPTQRPRSRQGVETAALGALERDIQAKEEMEVRLRDTLSKRLAAERALKAQLDAMVVAYKAAQQRQGARAQRDLNLPGQGGAGDGSGTPPTANGEGGAAEGGDGRRQGVLAQILATLNRIDKKLNGTIKVSGTVTERKARTRTTTEGEEGATPTATTRGKGKTRGAYDPADARSTEQGRADFAASIGESIPAVQQLLASGRDVEAAAELISRGVASETKVLKLYRDMLKQTSEQAKKFRTDVRTAQGDRDLGSLAAAARDQAAKERGKRFETRIDLTTGRTETLTVKQARQMMDEDLKARKRQEEAQRKATRAQREEAAAKLMLRQVTEQLSDSTKGEIAELERVAKGADDSAEAHERLVQQMAKVYGLVAQDLGAGARQTNQAVGALYQGAGIDSTGREVNAMRAQARDLGYQVDQAAAEGVPAGGIFGEQSAFTRAMFGNSGFWSRIMSSTGAFVVRNFTAGFVFGITNALQAVIQEAIETESAFIKVKGALEATGRDVGSLRTDLQAISTDYGVALIDVYDTAAGLTGLFDGVDEISGAARVVTQLQNISRGALNAKEAMGVLASITSSFGDELPQGVDGLEHIADVFTVIQERIGVNIEDSSEGVARISGLAQQVGLSLEESAVFVGEISKRTNQTGAAAGEQFSRIIAAAQGGRGRQILTENLGPESGIETALADRDYGDVLRILMERYDGLTKAQQANITVGLGGQRQAAAINALLHNGTDALDTVKAATYAKGQADERSAQIAKTLNSQLQIFNANMVALGQNIVRSGIVTAFAVILGGANEALQGINLVFSSINDAVDSSSILKWARNAGLGLLGLLVVLKLVQAAFRGFRATVNALPGVNRLQGAVNGVPPTDGQAGRPGIRQRASNRIGGIVDGVGTRDGGVRRAAGTFFSLPDRDGSAPVGRFGRALERVTAGPLNRMGSGLTRLSARLDTAAGNLAARGETGAAYRRSRFADYAASTGAFFTRAGDNIRSTFRGGNGLVSGGFMLAGQDLAARGAAIRQGAIERQSLLQSQQGGDLTRTQRTQLAATRLLGSATSTTGNALNRLGTTMRSLGVGAAAAQTGMAVLGIAITAMIAEGLRASQFRKDLDNAYEAVYGDKNTSAAGGNGERYTSPINDLYEQRREDMARGGFQEFMNTTGAFAWQSIVNPLKTVDQLSDERAGILPEGVERAQFEQLQRIRDQFVAIEDSTDPEAVKRTQEDLIKMLDASADGIKSMDDLSDEQKAAALAYTTTLRDTVAKMAAEGTLVAQGIKEGNALALEQFDGLLNTLNTLSNAGSSIPSNLAGIVDRMVEEGTPEDSTYREIAERLARGGLAQSQVFRLQRQAQDDIAESAAATLQALLESNADPEQIDAASDRLQQALAARESAQQSMLSALETESQQSLQYFGARNQTGRSFAAYREAYQQLEREADRIPELSPDGPQGGLPGSTPTDRQIAQREARRIAIRNRQDALNQQYNQALVTQRTNEERIEASRTANSRERAELELSIARIGLRTLRERLSRDRATQAEVRDAEIAYNQALLSAQQARIDEAAAARATATASISPGNQVAVTQAQVGDAEAAVRDARIYGESSTQYQSALQNLITTQESAAAAQAQVASAQASLADAYAQARGDAVGAARAQAQVAQLALSEARRRSGGAVTVEVLQAMGQVASANAAILQAQTALAQSASDVVVAQANARGDAVAATRESARRARAALNEALARSGGAITAEVNAAQSALIAADAAASQAQLDLVMSRYDVSIALANAAGRTVLAARRQLSRAQQALKAALDKSGGENTAEVQRARAEAITAEASLRDARLQDQLDTIDFNLQMGRITQASAVSALQQILRTQDLTRAQRRQLLLQIKGMQDSLSDSQFNFGDIKLPTPYQVRRYIEENRRGVRRANERATSQYQDALASSQTSSGAGAGTNTVNSNNTTITINAGTDVRKIEAVVRKAVGAGHRTRTSQPRRR